RVPLYLPPPSSNHRSRWRGIPGHLRRRWACPARMRGRTANTVRRLRSAGCLKPEARSAMNRSVTESGPTRRTGASLSPRVTSRASRRLERTSIDVVLIAAAGDEARLAEILPALDRPDFSARMLPGADASPRLLAAELSRCENPTIVVLAMGAALRGEALRRLVEVFTSRRDAWLRLLVVEFEPKRVHALIAPIRRAAETFRQQLAMVLVTSSRSGTTAAAYRLSARLEEFAPARERGAAVVIDDDDLLRDYVGPIPHHVRVPDVPRSRANLRVVLP